MLDARVGEPKIGGACGVAWLVGVSASLLVACASTDSGAIQREFSDSPPARENFEILGFTIGVSTIEEIESRLGSTRMMPGQRGMGYRFCFSSTKPDDETRVFFETDHLISSRKLTGFQVDSGGRGAADGAVCSQSERVSRMAATSSGIRLGLTKGEVYEIVKDKRVRRTGEFALRYLHPMAEADARSAGVPHGSKGASWMMTARFSVRYDASGLASFRLQLEGSN